MKSAILTQNGELTREVVLHVDPAEIRTLRRICEAAVAAQPDERSFAVMLDRLRSIPVAEIGAKKKPGQVT